MVRFDRRKACTGQYRARAVVNPTPTPARLLPHPLPAESIRPYTGNQGASDDRQPGTTADRAAPGRRLLRRSVRPSPEGSAAAPMPRPPYVPEQGCTPGCEQGGYPPRQELSRAGRLSPIRVTDTAAAAASRRARLRRWAMTRDIGLHRRVTVPRSTGLHPAVATGPGVHLRPPGSRTHEGPRLRLRAADVPAARTRLATPVTAAVTDAQVRPALITGSMTRGLSAAGAPPPPEYGCGHPEQAGCSGTPPPAPSGRRYPSWPGGR